jgi:Cyclin, C-terminal domain
MLTLSLLDYKICSLVWDNLRVAASLFLAAKILHKATDAEEIALDFGLEAESIKSIALQFMMMLGTEEKEDRLTAVKRMYAHSQYGYISNLKISLRPQISPTNKLSHAG